MSLGKKIYAGLWAITGGLLIALIAMFVGLNTTFQDKTPPKDGWTTKAVGKTDNIKFQGDAAYNVMATPTFDKDGNLELASVFKFDTLKQAATKHDFRNEYNANVFLVGALPANATEAAKESHFAIYVKAVRGAQKDTFVELTADVKGAPLNNLVNKKGDATTASLKEFALTDVKIVDEVALKEIHVTADGKKTVAKDDKDAYPTGSRLATANDDVVASIAALYDIDEWKDVITTKNAHAQNTTAAIGALFGIALVGTVFTTVGVSAYEKRRRGGNK